MDGVVDYGTATKGQRWALFCINKKDYRKIVISKEEASKIIEEANRNRKSPAKKDFQKIYDEAYKAGMEAGEKCNPTPMIVQQHKNMADDNSPIEQQWMVKGGVCGFAWINVKPATQAFAKWLKYKEIVKGVAYEGGYSIWVHEFGQSMEQKIAFASAFAEVLSRYRINCYVGSRLD